MLNWLNFGWSRWDSAMVTRRNHNFVPFWIKASGRWMKRDEFFPKFWKLWVCMFVVMWCFFQEISEKHEESIGVGRREFQITHSTNSLIRRLVRELLFKRSNGSFQLETEENGTVESWQQSEDANSTSKEWWMMMNVECVDDDSAQKLQCTNYKLKTTDLSQSFRVWCLKLGATMSPESSLVRKLAWKDQKKTVISV